MTMREWALLQGATRPVSLLWGLVVPSLIFLISFLVAYGLYRKFAPKEPRASETEHLHPRDEP